MERIFYKTILVILVVIMLSIFLAPISKAAYYTDNMKVGEKYKYKGTLLIVYEDKNAAKKSNIFKMEGILNKGSQITIQEKDGNILKIGNRKYIKLNFLNKASKFEKIDELKPQEIRVSEIKLNKIEATIYLNQGKQYKLEAIVTPNNATNKKVIWTSSNTNVATVDQNGLVTAINTGEVNITAKTEDGGKTSACKIKVTELKINEQEVNISIGETKKLEVISTLNNKRRTAKWTSDNSNIVTVDSNGNVKGINEGTTTIRATTTEGVKLVCNVTVEKTAVTKIELNKSTLKIGTGKNVTLETTISPSNATNKKVTWKSSNTDIVTVNASGKVTGKKAGKATITVTTNDGGKTAKCTVTVIQSATGVKLNEDSLEMYIGQQVTLTATVNPSNAENKNVTWSSDNTSIATVNSNGKITAIKEGKATITVTTNDGGKTAKCIVTVDPYRYSFGGNVYTIAVKKDTLDKVTKKIDDANIDQKTYVYVNGSPIRLKGKCAAVSNYYIKMLYGKINVENASWSGARASDNSYVGDPITSLSTLKKAINNQILTRIHLMNNDGQHWAVVIGYKVNGNGTANDLLYLDPYNGNITVHGSSICNRLYDGKLKARMIFKSDVDKLKNIL